MQIINKIWVNGCFDVLHRGHIELFEYCSLIGGSNCYVKVGIDSDKRVKELKGESRPFNNQEDRKYFLESIKFIDEVVIFDSETSLINNVQKYSPEIMVVGSDYKDKLVIGSEYASRVVYFDKIGGYSTTKILEKI
jgi:rfaE bifunctional protein nucleotidyltransferase chain/domain